MDMSHWPTLYGTVCVHLHSTFVFYRALPRGHHKTTRLSHADIMLHPTVAVATTPHPPRPDRRRCSGECGSTPLPATAAPHTAAADVGDTLSLSSAKDSDVLNLGGGAGAAVNAGVPFVPGPRPGAAPVAPVGLLDWLPRVGMLSMLELLAV